MSDRRETALAEIERRLIEWAGWGGVTTPTGPFASWVLAVLEGHKATLERHKRAITGKVCHCCEDFDPCPDAAHVLDLYAAEATP